MQNSSLHSFSLRLHFHVQYLQNKAYKHLIAKIFPEQLGYLALSAPSCFPSASLRSAFLGAERGSEVTHAMPIRRSSLRHTALPQRAARAGGTDSGAAPAAPGCLRAASARRAPRAPTGSGKRREAAGPALCRHGHGRHWRCGGEKRLKRRSCRRLAAQTCCSAWK